MTMGGGLGGDDAATRDAIAQLHVLDQADGYQPDAAPQERWVQPTRNFGREYQQPEPPLPAMPREMRTLEECIARYPNIGDGHTYLKVERTQPKSFMGHNCAGWLEDVHSPITIQEFKERFGGNRYIVSVMGPRGDRVDGTGAPVIYRLAQCEIQLPGEPRGEGPRDDMTQAARPGSPPFGSHPSVEIARIEAEKEERKFYRDLQRPDADALKVVQQTAADSLHQVRDYSERALVTVREQLKDAMLRLADEQVKNESLRNKLNDAQLAVQQARQQRETELVAELKERFTREAIEKKERYDADLRIASEAYAQKLERIESDHKQRITELSTQYNDARTTLSIDAARTRDQAREDSLRRETMLKDDMERRVAAQKDAYEARIADLTRQMERDATNLRDAHARELESVRNQTRSEVVMTKATAEMQVQTAKDTGERAAQSAKESAQMQIQAAKDRIAMMQAEMLQLRTENNELRAKTNKDVITQMTEAKELARLTGMIDASEAPTGEDNSFVGVAKQVIGKLAEAAPGVMQAVQQSRAQNQQKEAVAQQQAAMAQQQAMVAQQQAALAAQQAAAGRGPPLLAPPGQSIMQPQRAQQQRRSLMAPPPAWAGAGPPAPGAPPPFATSYEPAGIFPGPPPMAQPQAPTEPMTAAVPAAGGAVPPITPLQQAPTTGMAPMPQVQPYPPPAPPEAPRSASQQQPQQPPAQPGQITEEMVAAFIQRLEKEIGDGIATPQMFAQGFVEQVGKDMTRSLLSQLQPDHLFAMIENSPVQAANITTLSGKKYCREMWAAAQALTA